HCCVLNRWNPEALLENEVRFAKALLHIAGSKLEMFADIRQRAGHDEVRFVVLRIILVDGPRAGFRGFLRRKIRRQIFIFDFDQSNRSLRGIFVDSGNGCNRFSDVTHLSLSQEWSVLDGLAMNPRCICSRDDRLDSRIIFGSFRVDPFDDCVRSCAEQRLSVKHVGKDEIVAVNRLAGYFLLRIHARHWFPDDCKFFHISFLVPLLAEEGWRDSLIEAGAPGWSVRRNRWNADLTTPSAPL